MKITEEKIQQEAYRRSSIFDNLNSGLMYNQGFEDASEWMQEQLEQQWIPVTERLPEEKPFEAYKLLVYGDWNDEVIAVFQDKRFYDPNVNDESGDPTEITNLVTHWMPLPEPPKTV